MEIRCKKLKPESNLLVTTGYDVTDGWITGSIRLGTYLI